MVDVAEIGAAEEEAGVVVVVEETEVSPPEVVEASHQVVVEGVTEVVTEGGSGGVEAVVAVEAEVRPPFWRGRVNLQPDVSF